jgi:hypothetical protein
VRGIFDDRQVVLQGQLLERIHIAGQPAEMHGDDRLQAPARPQRRATAPPLDLGLHLVQVDIQCVRVDIDEHRASADMLDHIGRGAKGHRRCQHRVARADPQRLQAQE